jgi:hypothetical protein
MWMLILLALRLVHENLAEETFWDKRPLCPAGADTLEDSPAGLRNTLLLRPPTDKQLRPSVNQGYLDLLSQGKNHPGLMPESEKPDPAGLSRSQVQTDGKDSSEVHRNEEARAGTLDRWDFKFRFWFCHLLSSWATLGNLLTCVIPSFLPPPLPPSLPVVNQTQTQVLTHNRQEFYSWATPLAH